LSSLLISRGTLDTTARKLVSEIADFRLGEDGEIATGDDKVFSKLADIVLALSVPLSFGEFAKCADTIKFKSDIFRADILANSSKKSAQHKVSCILKKDQRAIEMPELIYWREE